MKPHFREQASAPAGASSTGSVSHASTIASLFASVVFVITAVMLAGPPTVLRSAILVGYLIAGVALCRGLFRLTDRAGWNTYPWLQAAGVAAMCALILGMGLFAMQSVLNGGPRWETLPWILALAFGISLSGCALSISLGRRRSAPAAFAPEPDPRFMARLPANLREAKLIALEAEDHYLRVHTSRGDALILMRLADAIAELTGMDGAQVHRSWWVTRAGVAALRAEGRQGVLLLANGRSAPVSRTRMKSLRENGWC